MINLCEIDCPECKQDYNGLSIDSSSALSISIITCGECGFRFEDQLCEEDLTSEFERIYIKERGEA